VVKPGRVVAKATRPRLAVSVASTGATPTGRVTVRVAGRKYVAQLRRGKAVVTLKAFAKAGKVRAKVSYAGDPATLSAARTVKIAVLAP
jgi:5'-nucleotidase